MRNQIVQCVIGAVLLIWITGTASGQRPDLQVTTALTPDTAYVNEQVLLRRDVNVTSTAFGITGSGTPTIGIAEVLQLSEKKQSGNARQQVQTHWAIFAREPGEERIAPQTFQATLPATGGTNPVAKANAQPLLLTILPAPQSPSGVVWLPAQALSIQQQWANSGQLVIGEPKELTITITTNGQRAAAIPPLTPPDIAGLRWYSSPPTLTDRLAATGVTGVRVERFTVVAQAGELSEIPAFSLSWFDTTTRVWRQTRSNPLRISLPRSPITETLPLTRVQFVLPALLFAMLIVIGWATFARYRRPTESVAWRRVKRKLRQSKARELREVVLVWAKLRWPSQKLMRLEQLAALLETPEQQQVVLALNKAAYSNSGANKQPAGNESLTRALETLRSRGLKDKADHSSLTPLYPTSARH